MFYLEWTRWHSYALCTADFGVQLPVGEKPGRTERRKIDENYGMDIFVGVRNLWKGRSYDKKKKMLGIVWSCTFCNGRVGICMRFEREEQGRQKKKANR